MPVVRNAVVSATPGVNSSPIRSTCFTRTPVATWAVRVSVENPAVAVPETNFGPGQARVAVGADDHRLGGAAAGQVPVLDGHVQHRPPLDEDLVRVAVAEQAHALRPGGDRRRRGQAVVGVLAGAAGRVVHVDDPAVGRRHGRRPAGGVGPTSCSTSTKLIFVFDAPAAAVIVSRPSATVTVFVPSTQCRASVVMATDRQRALDVDPRHAADVQGVAADDVDLVRPVRDGDLPRAAGPGLLEVVERVVPLVGGQAQVAVDGERGGQVPARTSSRCPARPKTAPVSATYPPPGTAAQVGWKLTWAVNPAGGGVVRTTVKWTVTGVPAVPVPAGAGVRGDGQRVRPTAGVHGW